MERLELNAYTRETGKGKSRRLRREGNVPAILYGTVRKPQSLYVNMREVDRVLNTDAGWNILLDLNIDGKEKVLTRISEYQADVLSRDLIHLDFQVLDLKKEMKTEVPIRLIGTAKGVKEGGVLELVRRSLEVKCFPTDIPGHIDIEVADMEIGQNIHVEEVVMPKDVECIYETNFVVATLVAPTVVVTPEAEVPPEEAVEEGAVPAEGEAAPAEGKPEGASPAKESEKK